MTYFRFHWIFNVPLLALLAALGRGEEWTPGAIKAAGWVVLVAFVFTTPWDNSAARRGIWGFPREKYTLRVGWLPIEEYLFFILQTINVILGVRLSFHWFPDWHRWIDAPPTLWTAVCLAISIPVWIAMGLQLRRWRRRQGPCVNYLLHLLWFLPVIYAQWLLAPRLFAAHVGLLALVMLAFGLYYTLADFLAVRANLWFFDPAQITGWKLAGLLPWEEIAFFCLTSLLVAQSYLLLLPAAER